VHSGLREIDVQISINVLTFHAICNVTYLRAIFGLLAFPGLLSGFWTNTYLLAHLSKLGRLIKRVSFSIDKLRDIHLFVQKPGIS